LYEGERTRGGVVVVLVGGIGIGIRIVVVVRIGTLDGRWGDGHVAGEGMTRRRRYACLLACR
jgi:hypothetical protein